MRRLLIAGCGDIALRTLPLLLPRYRVFALLRNPARHAQWRVLGAIPLAGDLDDRHSLARIAGRFDTVLHLAPPPNSGKTDTRTRNLLAALAQPPRQFVYISTSGVYGDCEGEWVSESQSVNPQSARALRRVDAESQIRKWASHNGVRASILRVPGIYAAERLPLDRLRSSTPVICAAEDGYTNHIHADDLARTLVATLQHGRPNRVYHVSDDSLLKMGDYFDAVAKAHGLPLPPRMPREKVECSVSPMLWSFMNESRRLDNRRMKIELRVVLRYPTVGSCLSEI